MNKKKYILILLIITGLVFIGSYMKIFKSSSKNKIQYVSNPDLISINKSYQGNRKIDGIFVNGTVKEKAPTLDVIKWKLTPNPQRKEKRNENYQLPIVFNENIFQLQKDAIVWLGHATFFIRINGVSFLTDPCFGDITLIKREIDFPCSKDKIKNIDYILISHGHHEHFDEESIKLTVNQSPNCKTLLPLKLGELYKKSINLDNFQEAGWYQQYQTNDLVSVYLLPSFHWHRRTLIDFNKCLWGSFLLKTKEISIYFGGDSGYSDHYKEIRDIVGAIDICILPIAAYKPEFIMKKSQLL